MNAQCFVGFVTVSRCRLYICKTACNGTLLNRDHTSMFQNVLPQVLLQLRRQPGGKENLNLWKFVSIFASRIGRVTDEQYGGALRFFASELKNLITSNHLACTKTLASLAKEFEYEYDVQHAVLFAIMECLATKHGENWKDLGTLNRYNTRLEENDELNAALLAGKLTFTTAEWELLDIQILEQTHCVEVGDSVFQVDMSKIDTTKNMAPVEVLHNIILNAMVNYDTNINTMVMCLFLLECLHQDPWYSAFKKDTYEVHAIRAFKLLILAMMHFAGDLEIQKSAFKACVHLSRNMQPGATYKVLSHGGHDLVVAVVATMRRFPTCVDIYYNGAQLIILDARKVPDAEPLHPERIKYQNSILKGLDKLLVKNCTTECEILFTELTCNVLKRFFNTRIVIMTQMQMYIGFFMWVFIEWDEVTPDHFALRDRAIFALIEYFEAKDKAPFTNLERAQHRDAMRKFINTYDMNQTKSEVVKQEWLGARILSYMCPYSTISDIRENTDRVCASILLLCELCQDSNESRKLFIYESNGINMCLTMARYFVERGSDDDMDIAVYVIDLLTSLYTQINCEVEKEVSPVILLTANASCFAVSYLHDIALPRYSNTAEASNASRHISSQSGTTLISVLQDIMRVAGVPQILLQSCMVTLAAVTILSENAKCIDTDLIQSIYQQDKITPSRQILNDKAQLILQHCRSSETDLRSVNTLPDQ